MVVSLSPGIAIPGEGATVELRSSKYQLSKKIIRIFQAGDDAVIAFSDILSINDALKIVGYSLYADVAEAKKKAAASVLGYSVFDNEGNCWGQVKAQPQYSLNQLLEVEDGRTKEVYYVPWHDSIVKKVDRCAKTIRIDPPPGLKELNR